MTEPQKTSHWNSLAETLGAKVTPPDSSADTSPPVMAPPPPLPRAPLPAKKERQKAAPRKGDWGLVASTLGIAPPPEPIPPPKPAPVALPPVAARPTAEFEPRPPREPRRRAEPERELEPVRESRSAGSPAREWDAPRDESVLAEDDLTLGEDDSDEIEIEIIDEAEGSEPPRGEGEQRADGAEGERRPRRRRRRRGRRPREESAEPREPRRERSELRTDETPRGEGDTDLDADEPRRAPEEGDDQAVASDDDRPRRKKRRRGRRSSTSGRERPPPRRPAPDESARDEEAAFISESGGSDEIDADFGPDDDDRGEPLDEIRVDRHVPEPEVRGDEDEHDDADDADGETEHAGKKHKIPSWQETVGILIDANLASRGKSSGHPQRGGRGRGRGRGR